MNLRVAVKKHGDLLRWIILHRKFVWTPTIVVRVRGFLWSSYVCVDSYGYVSTWRIHWNSWTTVFATNFVFLKLKSRLIKRVGLTRLKKENLITWLIDEVPYSISDSKFANLDMSKKGFYSYISTKISSIKRSTVILSYILWRINLHTSNWS